MTTIEERVIDNEEENTIITVDEECNAEHPLSPSADIANPKVTFPLPHSEQELCQLLSQRYMLQLSPEDDALLDPLERTVRYLIPIPQYYYWDVLAQQEQPASDDSPAFSTADIPFSIRLWHTAIGGAEYAGNWLNRRVAQPIAAGMGLTGPRFHEVINSMTEEELQQSRRRILERKRRDAERRSHI